MSITARAIPILSDNYAWLVRDEATGFTAVVDPAEAAPVVAAIEAAGRLDMILLTHHHQDHIVAVDAVRAQFPAVVVGNAADSRRLPKLDLAVSPGDIFAFGAGEARVIDTPGHTIGHIAFFLTPGDVLLCGDTLFSLGCGRLLEGTAAQMFASLHDLAALPGDTLVCCGHEYTESNARFALSADPDNPALQARADEVNRLRAAGQATVPSHLVDELAANPFLRAPDVATLADLRSRKDRFR